MRAFGKFYCTKKPSFSLSFLPIFFSFLEWEQISLIAGVDLEQNLEEGCDKGANKQNLGGGNVTWAPIIDKTQKKSEKKE